MNNKMISQKEVLKKLRKINTIKASKFLKQNTNELKNKAEQKHPVKYSPIAIAVSVFSGSVIIIESSILIRSVELHAGHLYAMPLLGFMALLFTSSVLFLKKQYTLANHFREWYIKDRIQDKKTRE